MQQKITLRGLDKMTKRERRYLSRWLMRQAKFILPMHREFAKVYTARHP